MVLFLLPNLSSSMIIVFLWSAPLFMQATGEVKRTMLNLLIHGTGPWSPLLVMSTVFSTIKCVNFQCILPCVVLSILWLLNALVEAKFKITSLFWSVALASLIHRNLLREHCNPVDWRILEGNASLASEWSTTLGVEFWAQHPPYTQTPPVFSPFVDWYTANTVLKFLASTPIKFFQLNLPLISFYYLLFTA